VEVKVGEMLRNNICLEIIHTLPSVTCQFHFHHGNERLLSTV